MNNIPIEPVNGNVAVIGGGIFGCLAALKLAEAGCDVTIFEAGRDILCGASLANQNRLHLGYHYPRSPQTARACAVYERAFRRMFPEAVIDFEHYYALAKGSKTSDLCFDDICFSIESEFESRIEAPEGIITTDKIDRYFRVHEGLIDVAGLRRSLWGRLLANDKIMVRLNDRVDRLHFVCGQWMLNHFGYNAVVNATYGNINLILGIVGRSIEAYQYELCEVVVITNPFPRRMGIGIMDGPFFGVLPFGLSENCLLYDVEHSVLAREIAVFPTFTINPEAGAIDRFTRYIDKARAYLPQMEKARRLYSMYAVKVTKIGHGHDSDDARPTEIINHGDGFFSIFAGKMSAAIPAADAVTMEVVKCLRK